VHDRTRRALPKKRLCGCRGLAGAPVTEQPGSLIEPGSSSPDASAHDQAKVVLPSASGPLAKLGRVLLLLSGEGASVAAFLCAVGGESWLPAFIAQNRLTTAGRDFLLRWIFTGALLPALLVLAFVGARWLKYGRKSACVSIDQASRIARICAMLLFVWALPQMVAVRAWIGRDLFYLVAAAVLVVTFEYALGASLAAASEVSLAAIAPRMRNRLARLPTGMVRSLPHGVVAAMVTAYIGYMSYFTVLQHLRRQTSGFDLGYYATFFWNTIHGSPFYCPITHPRAGSYLSIHAEPAVYLLAPLYALRPDASTLLIVQSAMLGLSAIPIYWIARKRLRSDWIGAVVAGAFLSYPPLHAPNFSDFHFLTISAFFILWAAYFFFTERRAAFWIFVVFSLMCREDVPFGGIGVGAALALSGRRVGTGAALFAVSAAYLFVVKFIIMPKYGDPSFVYIYDKLVAPGDVGFRAVAKTLLTNPLYTLATILLPEKIPYLLHVFVPLAFLPLRAKRYWFLLFPGFFVTLLSTGYLPVIQIRFQYVTHFTPYVFIGAILMLERLATVGGAVAQRAAVGALVFGTFLSSHEFGALQRLNFVAGGGRVQFDFTDRHRDNLRNLREIAATIPPNASVAATEVDTPHLAERHHLFTLKYEHQGADYLLYGYDALDVGIARRIVFDELSSGRFGFHAERPNFVVLRRGAPTDRNAELLRLLVGSPDRPR
jgi:uncharacterized membrane protein